MAGGTGGHVFPALAVADVLTKKGVEVQWIGTARGIEARLVPEAGYPLHNISVQGLRGNGLLGWLMAPFKLMKAVWEAKQVINQFKPDIVLGLGGFASGPGGVAAWLSKIPLVIHEQNAIPGLTNRLLSRLSKRVLQGFPDSFNAPIEAEWVGNPVRQDIAELPEPNQRYSQRSGQINMLVLGGSLGARSLNTIVPEAIALLPNELRPVITHQCGVRHVEQCKQAYSAAQVDANISAFVDDMAAAYASADLVVCRAGALTLAELAGAGVASLLVPYPYAVDDHQTHNASALVHAGAAILIQDADLTKEDLAERLRSLITNKERLLTMANAAHSQAKPEAAHTIATICEEVCHG
jgi:UDP-N-acetylglucosamine--N-acetylmuramyl-(pentapeptide) pyrophosphoryl-undecaprenol N-acetylglucosamine transferase